MFFLKPKESFKVIKTKNNDEIKITYNEIIDKNSYKKRQLIRLSKEMKKEILILY